MCAGRNENNLNTRSTAFVGGAGCGALRTETCLFIKKSQENSVLIFTMIMIIIVFFSFLESSSHVKHRGKISQEEEI